MKINTKRAYDPPAPGDGARYLVDRFWPRGMKRDTLELAAWQKDAAPSAVLIKWFGHDPERWDAFRERYSAELDANPEGWKPLMDAARHGPLTLVYGARDTQHNQAEVLKAYLERHA